MKIKSLGILFIFIAATFHAGAQGLAVNTDGSPANASAMMDVKSATQGVLVPRMLSSQRTLISSPATGLLVYQTNAPAGFYFYNGSAWVAIASSATSAGGDLSGTYPNPTIANSTVTPAKLSSSSGTAGNTTFYRGDGAWSNVNLASNVSGNIAVTNLNSGTGAGSGTFWRGDGTWAAASGGTGSVVSVSSGNLSPLFTSFVSGSVSPAISYSLTPAPAHSVFTNSVSATGTPAYGPVVPQALYASSGSPSSSTFYRGDGSWQALSSGKTIMYGYVQENALATAYAAFSGVANSATNVYGNYMPTAVTVTALYIAGIVATSNSTASTHTITLYVNGSPTTLTANFTTPASPAVGTQFSANMTGASISISAGDLIQVREDMSTTSGSKCNMLYSIFAN